MPFVSETVSGAIVEMKSGQVLVARMLGGDAAHLLLASDSLRPTKVIKLTLEQAEILDLLEYLRVEAK